VPDERRFDRTGSHADERWSAGPIRDQNPHFRVLRVAPATSADVWTYVSIGGWAATDGDFGPEFVIDKELDLECLRIPHFYRAFYVYKYATGLSAAIALSQRVLHGGKRELSDYLNFLKGGSSKYPLELLRDAGVDMEQPDAVNAAMGQFERMVGELDELL